MPRNKDQTKWILDEKSGLDFCRDDIFHQSISATELLVRHGFRYDQQIRGDDNLPFQTLFEVVATNLVSVLKVVEVEVKWLKPSPNVRLAYPPKPEATLNRKTLNKVVVIGVPSSETLGINSVRMLKLKPEDYITNFPSWLGAFRKRFVNGIEGAEPVKSPITATATLRLLVEASGDYLLIKTFNFNQFMQF